MLPLTMAKPGETVIIRKIGGSGEVRQHLSELGFVVEEKITVVSESGGNLILKVKDSRIALDQSLARNISIMIEQSAAKEKVLEPGRMTYGIMA